MNLPHRSWWAHWCSYVQTIIVRLFTDDFKESPMDYPIRSNIGDIVDVCNEQVSSTFLLLYVISHYLIISH